MKLCCTKTYPQDLKLPIHLLKQYHIYESKTEFLQNL